jgi:hypothetical protein
VSIGFDPCIFTQIAAQLTQFAVTKSRGGYVILDRHTSSPVAGLGPISGADRVEFFC